jgi:hypothetical protein
LIDRNGDLHRFLYSELASDEAMQIVLHLAADPHNGHSLDSIRRGLPPPTDDEVTVPIIIKRLEIRLRELIARGLAALDPADGLYRYAAGNSNDGLVRRLLQMTDGERDTAARMIYIVPRLSGAAAFAEAFNWPKGSS